MNHVLIGSAVPFVVALVVFALRGGRFGVPALLVTPAAMLLGALWAVVPDIPRIAGMYDVYLDLMQSPRADIFFWHHTLDRIESGSPWYAAGVAALYAALILLAWNELRRREAN